MSRTAVMALWLPWLPVAALSQATYTWTWSSGDLSLLTIPTNTVGAAQSLLIQTSGNHDLNGQTLTNNGTIDWTAGYLRGGSGGAIVNATGAFFNDYMSGGYTVHNPGWGGTFVFTNNGTYTRNAANTTAFDVPFNNNGTVDLQAGAIQFRAGGSMSATGTMTAASGTTVTFTNGYTIAAGASLGGAGSFALSGGTLNLNGDVDVGNFTQTDGQLAGTVTLNGLFNWNGGAWSGANVTIAASTGQVTMSSGANHDLNSGTIVNNGTVDWISGYLRGGSGAIFTNNGTFNDKTSGSYTIQNPGWGGSFTFINNGDFVRNTAGTTYFDVPLTNNGDVDLQTGAIQIRAGGSMSATGTMTAASGTTITFTNGYTIADGASLGGAGSFVLSGGTLNLNGDVDVGNFTQTAGQLAGTMTLHGLFNWNGGAWSGAHVTIAASTGHVTMGSGANHDLNSGTIVNNGTVDWSSGYIRGGSGASFTNNGTFNDLNASSYYIQNPGWGGSFAFINNGDYIRDAVGTTYVDVALTNNGTIDLQAGAIQFRSGGSMSATGTMTAAGGATITFTNGYTIADGASLGGSGSFVLSGGTLNLDGDVDVGNFTQTDGQLAGTMALHGLFNWNGGAWSGAHVTIAASTGHVTMGSGANHDLNSGTIVNNGAVDWTSGYIRGGSGATFTNNGTFNDLNASSYYIQNPGWGGSFVFINNGDYIRNAANTTYIDVPFNNNGAVDLQQGDIQLRGGGTMSATGSITAASGTNVYITNGYTIADASSLNGAGTFRLTNGTLNLDGNVGVGNFVQTGGALAGTATISGLFSWNGGTWSGSNIAIAGSTGQLSLGNGANHDLNSGTIVNHGTVDWLNGYIRGGSNATFTNASDGTFNDKNASSYSIQNPGWGGSFTFNNDGNYVRNAAGTTYLNAPFNNSGAVDLQQGDIQVNAGGTMSATGTINAASGTHFYFASNYTLVSGATFTGTGLIAQTGGTLTIDGTLAADSFAWNGGDWNAATTGLTTTISDATILNLGNGANHDFRQRAIVNDGTVNWINGYIRSGADGSFTNAAGGIFNDLNAASYSVHNPSWGGTFVFANDGTYIRDAAGTTFFNTTFDNSGTIDLRQGDIQINAGGTMSATSIAQAAASTHLYFSSNYVLLDGASLQGTGSFIQNGGTLTIDGDLDASNFNWYGGDWNAATTGLTTTIASGTVLNLGNGANHDFRQRAIVNDGTVNWINGYIRSGADGSFTNAAGGTFNDLNAAGYSVHNPSWGGSFVFTNDGDYVRNAAGTTSFNTTFDNNGTVDLQSGSIQLNGGGAMSASSVVNAATGTNVTFNSNYTIATGARLVGPGTFTQSSGTLTANGTLTADNFNWYGGDWNASSTGLTTTIDTSTVLNLGNGANHDFRQRAIVNDGTVNWTSGYIRSGSDGSFINAAGGTFNDLNVSGYTVHNPSWGGTFTFANDGTYRRNGNGASVFNVPFTNAGVLELDQGTLAFQSGLTLASTSSLLLRLDGTTRGSAYGAIDVSSATTLAGTLSLFLREGSDSWPRLGPTDTFTIFNVSSGSLTGSFTNVANGGTLLTTDGFGMFTVNYGINSVVLSNFTPVPEPSTWALLMFGAALVAFSRRQR